MKHPVTTMPAMLLAAMISLTAPAGTAPGFVEFGKLNPPGKGAEFVEVQLRSNLINIAARLVERHEPEAARLLRSVELVQVKVVGITDGNREDLEKLLGQVRTELEGKNWERNVTVQGKEGEDVAVYTKTRGSDALSGVTITVRDARNVVLVNVVGDIKPEEVAKLGEKLNIEPLKQAGEAIKQDK